VTIWEKVPLSEVALIGSGSGFPIKYQGEKNKEFPFLKVSDMNLPGNEIEIVTANNTVSNDVRQQLRATVFPAGSVIFPKIGAAIATNKKRVLTKPSCVDNNVMAISPKGKRLNHEFLFYLFKSKNLSDFASDSNPPSIRKTTVEHWNIPLPPVEEQRRVIDILKRSDGIRRLRKQAQDTTHKLISALFVDIFGNPATNPKGWPMRKISEFVERFEGGKNLKAGTETPDNFRILKVSAVTSGLYIENEAKPAPDGYVPPESHYVRKGDLLFSRANTEALVGATALVDGTNGKTLLPDKLWRFVWAEEVNPIYICALFQDRHVRRELSKLSTGTSASMRNISQGKLKALKLPIAPIAAQKRFAERVIQVQAIQKQQLMALTAANDLFNSVMARAFSSTL